MAEENKKIEGKAASSGKFEKGLAIVFAIMAIGALLFLIISGINDNSKQKATMNDIDGYWNSTVSEQSYVFIPKYNINGLEFTFSIRDKNNKELQTIVKTVGDVKKGQQYTVSISMTELKDFTTLMDANYTQLTITGGTKKLI